MEVESVGGIGGVSRIRVDHEEDVRAIVTRNGLKVCSFESDRRLVGSDCRLSAEHGRSASHNILPAPKSSASLTVIDVPLSWYVTESAVSLGASGKPKSGGGMARIGVTVRSHESKIGERMSV